MTRLPPGGSANASQAGQRGCWCHAVAMTSHRVADPEGRGRIQRRTLARADGHPGHRRRSGSPSASRSARCWRRPWAARRSPASARASLVVGAALLAVPVTRLMRAAGRRPGLVLAYRIGAVGAACSSWSRPRGLGAAAVRRAVPVRRRQRGQLPGPLRRGRPGRAGPPRAAAVLGRLGDHDRRGRRAQPGPGRRRAVHRLGTVKYSGPFVFSAVAFLLAGVVVFLLLRPDPLLTARAGRGRAGLARCRPARRSPAVCVRRSGARSASGPRPGRCVAVAGGPARHRRGRGRATW